MKDSWKFISNPFYKVAGYKAAGWGILGIVITTVIAMGQMCIFMDCFIMVELLIASGGVLSWSIW